MKILHISQMKLNEVATLITTAGESLDDYVITAYSGVETFGDYDAIVLGINDGGVSITEEEVNALLIARDENIPIILTHDCPQKHCFENYEALSSLNLATFQNDYAFKMFTDVNILNNSHPILTTPYDLSEGFSVQQTHSVGSLLNPAWTILIESAEEDSSRLNHYLAILEQESKGKVIHWNCGHNNYSSEQFFCPSADECRLFINILEWATSPLETIYGNLS